MFVEEVPDRAEQRAKRIIDVVASWFPALLLVGIAIWLGANVVFQPFEPYPMIMLAGLAAPLSTIAALQGALILLTQRRSARRDRERDRETYLVASHSESDLHDLRDRIDDLAEELRRMRLADRD